VDTCTIDWRAGRRL